MHLSKYTYGAYCIDAVSADLFCCSTLHIYCWSLLWFQCPSLQKFLFSLPSTTFTLSILVMKKTLRQFFKRRNFLGKWRKHSWSSRGSGWCPPELLIMIALLAD